MCGFVAAEMMLMERDEMFLFLQWGGKCEWDLRIDDDISSMKLDFGFAWR